MEPISTLLGICVGQAWDLTKTLGVSVGEALVEDKAETFIKTITKRLKSSLPKNHDLIREIRGAELVAARRVQRAYQKWLNYLPAYEKSPGQTLFATKLDDFLSARLKPHTDGGIDFQALSQERIGHVLDEMINAVIIEGAAEGTPTPRQKIESAFLAEIAHETDCQIPPDFQDFFTGTDPNIHPPQGGWYDMVALYITEEIKENERFKSIFFATELVDIKRLIVELTARIAAFTTQGVPAIGVEVKQLLRDIKEDTSAIRASQAEVIARLEMQEALIKQLLACNPTPAGPGAEKRVGEAVADIAKGAAAGDNQLAAALDLLRENKIGEATALLRSVAEDRAARIQRDRKDAATAYRNLGAIAGLGNPKEALEAYEKAFAFDPEDRESALWLGWLRKDRGMLNSAEQAFRHLLAVAANELDSWARNWATLGLGDILIQRGNLPAALEAYRESLATMERLAKADPADTGWQRDLSVSHNKIGDVQAAQGDLPAALKSYQASHAIRDRLAKADPANAQWQRDLSVSHDKIGDVQTAQGDLPAALKSYQASLAIADRLAKADPANAVWQRDLSVSHEKIGNVQAAQGDLQAALKSYQASHAIRDRLAKADPANAGWQRDLAVSFGNVAVVEAKQGLTSQGLAGFRRGRDIIAQLMQKSPDNATLPNDLAQFDWWIAALEKP